MIDYTKIVEANRCIGTTNIKGKEYAEVNQRVKAFRMLFPTGCISTEIVSLTDGMVVVKATAYDEDGKTLATGLAFEKEQSSYINKTSFIENCETSAVGRCLGFVGLGIDASICSAEELCNALEQQTKTEQKPKTELASASYGELSYEDRGKTVLDMISGRYSMNAVLDSLQKNYGKKSLNELTSDEWADFKEKLKEAMSRE